MQGHRVGHFSCCIESLVWFTSLPRHCLGLSTSSSSSVGQRTKMQHLDIFCPRGMTFCIFKRQELLFSDMWNFFKRRSVTTLWNYFVPCMMILIWQRSVVSITVITCIIVRKTPFNPYLYFAISHRKQVLTALSPCLNSYSWPWANRVNIVMWHVLTPSVPIPIPSYTNNIFSRADTNFYVDFRIIAWIYSLGHLLPNHIWIVFHYLYILNFF